MKGQDKTINFYDLDTFPKPVDPVGNYKLAARIFSEVLSQVLFFYLVAILLSLWSAPLKLISKYSGHAVEPLDGIGAYPDK